MTTSHRLARLASRFSFTVVALFVLFATTRAVGQSESSGTGTISGRVLNPATGEYLRNAEVRVKGTDHVAVSEAGGFYQLFNVPAGEATLEVIYSGYSAPGATVNVTAGATATHDFQLSSISLGATKADEVITLSAFVVSGEKEGNAKAIQAQRNSMNVSRTVASDIFGDVTEGNVGEFLKYLPGVELEYVEADTRGPRLGGMDPQYAGVSIDGMKLASADAFVQFTGTENGPAGTGSRSFGFEQVSINSIESIEINRVTAADMDADSPAGNINLRTKRAFDSKGRRITWNVSTVFNSEEFHAKKNIGPSDGRGYKFKPNYSLSYQDVFLGNRLGILIGVSESNLYNEQYRIDHTYNRTTTATDTRPQVLTSINFKDGPKWTKRFTTTFTADYKATRRLVLSLGSTFNAYDGRFYNRNVVIQAATNNTAAGTGRQFAGGDGITTFSTAGATAGTRNVQLTGGNGVKLTNTFTVVPKFEYNVDRLRVDGAFAYSRSRNDYDNLARGTVANTTVNNLTGVDFTATRPDPKSAEWQVRQTGGADWADLANYTNPRITDDSRFARNQVYSSELNGRYTLPSRIPTFIKTGAKMQERYYDFDDRRPIDNWTYVGPGGGTTGSFANYTSPFVWDLGQTGGRFTSISGRGAPSFPNRDALGGLFRSNPEQFTPTFTPANYESAAYLNRKEYLERVTSGYVMGNVRPLRNLQVQAGIRWEKTETISKEFDPLPNSDVAAAGFPVTLVGGQPIGAPTTFDGMIYKYTSRPRVERVGEYDNFFPSASAKYTLRDNLIADVGYGRTIKRPDVNFISGVWLINEELEEIRAPNAGLKPEIADKLVAAINYYFSGSGNLGVTLSETSIKNLRREEDFTAEEFGIEDPEFASYRVISSSSEGPAVEFRSLELAYNQPLSFLPSFLRGTRVFGTYTRTYASERRGGLTPHTVSFGLDYTYRKFSFNLKGVWQDEAPWFNTVGRFRRQNTKYDFGFQYRVARRLTLYASARNIFQTPHRIFDAIDGNTKVLTRLENYGTNWSFGVRGTF